MRCGRPASWPAKPPSMRCGAPIRRRSWARQGPCALAAGSPPRKRSPSRFGSGDLMSPVAAEATRYEQIMAACSVRPGDLADRFAYASRAARAAVDVRSEHEAAIRDVAAGVAAPALVAFVIWMQQQSRLRGLRRLRFLSRDGQVLYELTRRLAPMLGAGLDLEYVYSSRLTWGAYPYDSDPAGTAVRPLARPFTGQDRAARGDRAWLAGSLALSAPEARAAYLRHAPEHEVAGAPETD